MNRLLNYIKLLGAVITALVCFCQLSSAGVIKAGDLLELSLRGVPASEQIKVNGKYRVRDSGIIRIPMIEMNIRAAGKKPEDVERVIEQAFKKAEIYVSPTVSLEVRNEKIDERKVVNVGGHVRKNGRVIYREGMTMLEAIQQAGGRDAFGSKYVLLTRKNAKGQSMRYKFNINDPRHQVEKVYPDDLIHVPQAGPFERR